MNANGSSRVPVQYIGAGMAIGVAIGVAIGIAMGNLSLGIGPGIALGVGGGFLAAKRAEKKQNPQASQRDDV